MTDIFVRLNSFLDLIWPGADKPARVPNWQLFILAFLIGTIIALLTRSTNVFLGTDWFEFFFQEKFSLNAYPPWTSLILSPFSERPVQEGAAFMNGFTIAAITTLTYREANNSMRGLAVVMALLSFPTIVILGLGQIDGYAMLGLLGLPWTTPLVLMKPTFIGFSMITQKSWFIAASLLGLLSVIIWPRWPLDMLVFHQNFRVFHFASSGWHRTGLLPVFLGVLLLLNSGRTNRHQAMAAGALLFPFVLPYHFVVLLPALGRLRGVQILIAWLSTWLMLIPIFFRETVYLYYAFPLVIWFFSTSTQRREETWLALFTMLAKTSKRTFSQ